MNLEASAASAVDVKITRGRIGFLPLVSRGHPSVSQLFQGRVSPIAPRTFPFGQTQAMGRKAHTPQNLLDALQRSCVYLRTSPFKSERPVCVPDGDIVAISCPLA